MRSRVPARVLAFVVALFGMCRLAHPAESAPANDKAEQWQTLFDGKTLGQWKVVSKGEEFEQSGMVKVDDGLLVLEKGKQATGVHWTGKFPTTDYELAFDGKRVAGEDFFCGMTFPVGDGSLTLILGGWGGWVVGLSCIDDRYAINNDSCRKIEFEQDRWYRVLIRVTEPKIQVWVDGDELIDFTTEGHKFTVSEEMTPCLPVGIATWKTTGALRNLRFRPLERELTE